jgi:hypothetical protein
MLAERVKNLNKINKINQSINLLVLLLTQTDDFDLPWIISHLWRLDTLHQATEGECCGRRDPSTKTNITPLKAKIL